MVFKLYKLYILFPYKNPTEDEGKLVESMRLSLITFCPNKNQSSDFGP